MLVNSNVTKSWRRHYLCPQGFRENILLLEISSLLVFTLYKLFLILVLQCLYKMCLIFPIYLWRIQDDVKLNWFKLYALATALILYSFLVFYLIEVIVIFIIVIFERTGVNFIIGKNTWGYETQIDKRNTIKIVEMR